MKAKNKLPPWLRPKTPAAPLRVGVGWYTAEEWRQVKAAAVDPERFEASFDEWQAMAEESVAQLRANGIDARKSSIVASELLAWCLVTGKANDAAARAEFVSQQEARAGTTAASDPNRKQTP